MGPARDGGRPVSAHVFLALVHHPTVDRGGAVVTTAVTTLDLHDFCRLARTYGLGGVYATTPLSAQRDLVHELVEHWVHGYGSRANPFRKEALEALAVVESLDAAAADVERRCGVRPRLVGTSARTSAGQIAFSDARSRLEAPSGPVVLAFGTGWGLADDVLESCDWLLEPVRGAAGYNHLSVRSAASIVVDRLLGEW